MIGSPWLAGCGISSIGTIKPNAIARRVKPTIGGP
jgi:hypothetical protein